MKDIFKFNFDNNGLSVTHNEEKLGLVSYSINYHTSIFNAPGTHTLSCVVMDKKANVYDVFHSFETKETSFQKIVMGE